MALIGLKQPLVMSLEKKMTLVCFHKLAENYSTVEHVYSLTTRMADNKNRHFFSVLEQDLSHMKGKSVAKSMRHS